MTTLPDKPSDLIRVGTSMASLAPTAAGDGTFFAAAMRRRSSYSGVTRTSPVVTPRTYENTLRE